MRAQILPTPRSPSDEARSRRAGCYRVAQGSARPSRLAGWCRGLALAAALGSLALSAAAADFEFVPTAAWPESPAAQWSPIERGLLALTNDYRARLGLGRWQPDPGLQAVARAAGERMAREGRASHDGFHARFQRSGAYLCVEVIARGRMPAATAVYLWQRSPEHHRNLIEPRARWAGVAEVDGYATMIACDLPAR